MVLKRPGQIASYERELYAVGAEIIAKNQSKYAGLTGRIIEIRTGKESGTPSDKPEIYCQFDTPKTPEEIEKLKTAFEEPSLAKIPLEYAMVEPDEIFPIRYEIKVELYDRERQITWIRFAPTKHLGLNVESGVLGYRAFERLMKQCNVDSYPQNAEQVANELLDESNTSRRYVVPGTLAYASAAMRYEAHEADAEYSGMTAETLLRVLDDIRSCRERENEYETNGRWTASDEMYSYRDTRHGLRM